MKILIVEDEKITRITLADILTKKGHAVTIADNGLNGIKQIQAEIFDLVVTDLKLPGKDGLEVLKAAKTRNKTTEVVLITAYATVETAVGALKLGAYDYITKPLTPERFLRIIEKIDEYRNVQSENATLKSKLQLLKKSTFIAASSKMREVLKTIENSVQHDYTVLIQGESGTGKEVVAKLIHEKSKRGSGPFVAINCAAIPESLLESELFGHEAGAFSGAVKQHRGYFERASGGTIFIDDIDDLPKHLQVKLLRVIQERQLTRVGGSDLINLDVRIICATKVSLLHMVNEGQFREDLYYRLHIIPLVLPPLRERKEDIPALANHFFDKSGEVTLKNKADGEFYERLMELDWPGNVRQLENTIERIIATKNLNVPKIMLENRNAGRSDEYDNRASLQNRDTEGSYPDFDTYIKERELEIIHWALEKTNFNISKAAQVLELPRGTLRSKIKKLGIQI